MVYNIFFVRNKITEKNYTYEGVIDRIYSENKLCTVYSQCQTVIFIFDPKKRKKIFFYWHPLYDMIDMDIREY